MNSAAPGSLPRELLRLIAETVGDDGLAGFRAASSENRELCDDGGDWFQRQVERHGRCAECGVVGKSNLRSTCCKNAAMCRVCAEHARQSLACDDCDEWRTAVVCPDHLRRMLRKLRDCACCGSEMRCRCQSVRCEVCLETCCKTCIDEGELRMAPGDAPSVSGVCASCAHTTDTNAWEDDAMPWGYPHPAKRACLIY